LAQTAIKAVNNVSLQSSGSQTFNQQRGLPTDGTDAAAAVTSPAGIDYEIMSRQLEQECTNKAAAVNAKFNQLKELVKS